MNRIYSSLGVIIASAALMVVGSTGAFFSDTETSTGNTFAAGAIDLKIDNDSYYNGNLCTDIDQNPDDQVHNWQWQGNAAYPVAGTACTTSFLPSDLDNGLLFFNFNDLKPDDEGEDTISIHAQNEAWVCMDLTLTSNDDKSSTEPELETPDVLENALDMWDGELAQNLQFFWWADDGDNVYEANENSISDGIKTLYNLATTTPWKVALADATHNVWGTPGPIPLNATKYIGKAWCLGTLELHPVDAGQGDNPSVNPGVTCNGTLLNNLTQTDGATLDIQFRAEQARHNGQFICNPPTTATLTLVKEVTGGNALPDSWLLDASGPTHLSGHTGEGAVTGAIVIPGPYDLSESAGSPDYNASSWQCTGGTQNDVDTVTIAAGQNVTCTITNSLGSGNLHVVKVISGDGPNAGHPENFSFQLDGGVSTPFEVDGQNDYNSVVLGNHTVVEDASPNYTTTYSSDVVGHETDCANLPVANASNVTCTVTNTYVPVCNAHLDMMIVLDNSTSIDAGEETTMKAQTATFVTNLTISVPGNNGGLVRFSDNATLSQQLTGNQANLLTAVNAAFINGSTNLAAGINSAETELESVRNRLPDSDPNFPNVMVIVTDGNPTSTGATPDPAAEAAALIAANAAKAAGTEIYVVGVGADVNAAYGTTIASPGRYYGVANFSDVGTALANVVSCGQPPAQGTLTVTKVVVGGPLAGSPQSFNYAVNGGVSIPFLSGGTSVLPKAPSNYSVTEPAVANYATTYANSSNANLNCTNLPVPNGGNVTCTVTNTLTPPVNVDVALNPNAGTDTTPVGSSSALSGASLTALTTSNNTRYTTVSDWEQTGYITQDVLDFAFPDIPGTATVNSVSLSFEWQRESDIDAAQLSFSTNGGSSFSNITNLAPLPVVNTDGTVVIDLDALGINTAAEVNGLVIRFQANSDGAGGNYNTSHDWVQVDVNYTP